MEININNNEAKQELWTILHFMESYNEKPENLVYNKFTKKQMTAMCKAIKVLENNN